jgi:oxygen-independent coproporphyrinogen-3 oxidase
LGSFGLENKVYYENIGTIDSWKKKTTKLTNDEYYLQVLMMGLRLVNGINISKEPYRTAYSTYKDKLKYVAVKNNMLYAKNINLLNESIIDCL